MFECNEFVQMIWQNEQGNIPFSCQSILEEHLQTLTKKNGINRQSRMCWMTSKPQLKSLISFVVSQWSTTACNVNCRHQVASLPIGMCDTSSLERSWIIQHGSERASWMPCSSLRALQSKMTCMFSVSFFWLTLLCWFCTQKLETAFGSSIARGLPERSSCKPGNLEFWDTTISKNDQD